VRPPPRSGAVLRWLSRIGLGASPARSEELLFISVHVNARHHTPETMEVVNWNEVRAMPYRSREFTAVRARGAR
jgi:hypothetical protein